MPYRAFDDEADNDPVRRLTRADVAALREREPVLSPWTVVAAQVAVGLLAAAVAALAYGTVLAAASALYGGAVVALPGALMARGATSRLTSISPLLSALGLLGWGFVKMAASVAMLVLAARIVPRAPLAGDAGDDGGLHADVLVRAALARPARGGSQSETLKRIGNDERHGSRRACRADAR